MALAVVARGLSKTYRPRRGTPVTAVDGIDLEIGAGVLFGFLGPNGAGKTTLMDMVRAAVEPSSGSLIVLGHDAQRDARGLKARIGVAPQEDNLDPDFTVHQNLLVYARYFDIAKAQAHQRADRLLAFVGLTEKADTLIEHLSGGMKRRLVLARALINEPELLILDEPTTGLDPQARHLVWDKIRQSQRAGLTILLTTHYMDEAERLCDQIVVVDHGRILESGTPQDLIAKHAGREVIELTYTDPGPRTASAIRESLSQDERLETSGERFLVYTARADHLAPILRQDTGPETVLVRRAGLEDVFLRLTGRELRE